MLSNKKLRERARRLLDDDIFGKDWLKSVAVVAMMDLIVGAVAAVLLFVVNNPIITFLLKHFGHLSPKMVYVIPVVLYIVELFGLNMLIGPLRVGLAHVHANLVNGDETIRIKRFFMGFKNFKDNFVLGFMYMLHIGLWGLLFVVPGVYAFYNYSMIFRVKREHPEFTWKQCFDESERLMTGHRLRLLWIDLSFVLMSIGATVLTFFVGGIGIFWVNSYRQVTIACFFQEICEKAE